MKKESFLTTLFVFLLIAIFIFFGFAQDKNTVRVIYTFDNSSYYDTSEKDNKNTKRVKSDTKNNNYKKSSNKNKSKYKIVNENDNKVDLSFNEEMIDKSDEDPIDNNGLDNDKEDSEDMPSLDEDNSSNQQNITYQDLLNKIYSLQDYGIIIFVNWIDDIVDDNYEAIEDISVAKQMVDFVEKIVNTAPRNYFNNLKSKGFTTQFLLVNEDTNGDINEDNSFVSTIDDNTVTYIIKNTSNLTISKFLHENYNVNVNIIGKNKMNVMYHKINKFNPTNFKYGNFDEQFVHQNYFLDIQSQKSIVADCSTIFIKYYSQQLDKYAYENTALFNKINTVIDTFDKEVFY